MLTQVQESVQPLVNAALLIFTGPAAAEQPLMPAFAPIVLPSQRAVTGVISENLRASKAMKIVFSTILTATWKLQLTIWNLHP